MTQKVKSRPAVESRPVAELREWGRNPRRIGDAALERLKRSLEAEPGMLDARPVIALPDGTVIAGNMRLRAARELGWESIPTAVVDLDENRAREWALRDNASYGAWDDAELSDLLREMQDEGADLALTGFDDQELARLLAGADGGAGIAGDVDEAPDLPEEPVSEVGEVYELGPHRLICGDSTDPAVLQVLMAGGVASCMWTDPPYGIDYQVGLSPEEAKRLRRRSDGLVVSNDGEADASAVVPSAFAAVDAVLEPGAPVYIAHPAGPQMAIFTAAMEAAGWEWRQSLVWVKDQLVLGRADYHGMHEQILYGFKPASGRGRLGRGGSRWFGDDAQTSVFSVPRPKRSEEHPTMKPVELVRQMLANSLPPEGVVIDPFGGSGTTLLAAHALRRRACLVELDPRYCDVIRARWEAAAVNVKTTVASA